MVSLLNLKGNLVFTVVYCLVRCLTDVTWHGSGPDESAALGTLQWTLSDGNEIYKRYTEMKVMGAPTIRVLAPGTFRDYREWKI